jgi:hypothetical protein
MCCSSGRVQAWGLSRGSTPVLESCQGLWFLVRALGQSWIKFTFIMNHFLRLQPERQKKLPQNQCCWSMTVCCGSRSADPCLWQMDPSGPDPFVITFKTPKKTNFLILFEATLTSFFKDKKSKRSYKIAWINGTYSLLLMIGSGSGSWSRRPKNMWIWQIRSGSATLLITSIHKPDYCFGLRIFAHDGDFLALCNS